MEIIKLEVTIFSYFLPNFPIFYYIKCNKNDNNTILGQKVTGETFLETRRVGLQHMLELVKIDFLIKTPLTQGI